MDESVDVKEENNLQNLSQGLQYAYTKPQVNQKPKSLTVMEWIDAMSLSRIVWGFAMSAYQKISQLILLILKGAIWLQS